MRKIAKFTALVFLMLMLSISMTVCETGYAGDGEFEGKVRAHFIDVGQGDSILVKALEGDERRKMLIDAGENWEGRDSVVPYLQELNIETIHLAVATHPHADHIGGFVEVFDNFEVEKIVDSGSEHDTNTYEEYMTAIEKHNIEFVEGRAGLNKPLMKDLEFEMLNPADPLSGDLHYDNIIGQLRHDDIGFMFTGDIESEREESILERKSDLENNILKVAHHGSSTSTIPEFLDAVDPEAAVIQVGEDNRYGHPHDVVIERLDDEEVDIFRNDYHGDVVVETDGQVYTIEEDPYDPGEDYDNDVEKPEKININTADYEELQEITGVGPAIAENIIEYREEHGPFETIEEIKNIDGIAEGRFEDMKDEITV